MSRSDKENGLGLQIDTSFQLRPRDEFDYSPRTSRPVFQAAIHANSLSSRATREHAFSDRTSDSVVEGKASDLSYSSSSGTDSSCLSCQNRRLQLWEKIKPHSDSSSSSEIDRARSKQERIRKMFLAMASQGAGKKNNAPEQAEARENVDNGGGAAAPGFRP